MNISYRRYEILLPQRLNDGRSVPDEWVAEAVYELRVRFGSVSSETQTILGQWTHEGQVYRDELLRIFVDVPDLPENREFFVQFKERAKARFQQIELWLTSYPLDVL